MWTKNSVRKDFLELRNSMSADILGFKSKQIEANFFKTQEYADCEIVFAYMSIGSEVKTEGIVNRILAEGKRLALPKVIKEKKKMVFIEIKSLEELKLGAYKILEPSSSSETVSDNKTLILVPGVAFDKRGYRIGYGGGYYDKFFAENLFMKSIALAYDFQITVDLPTEEFDIPVDTVLTN